MIENGELALKLSAPAVTPEQVEQLVAVLREGAGWMKADAISEKMPGTNERKVRKIASAAGASIVSYPGSPGYKLWAFCTVDEISHAINSLQSQASDMVKRANLYSHAYHRRFRCAS